MEKQKTKQKGITLIALVISIIVMLILAGVSLNMTIGENGIIKQAQGATYQQSRAILEEYINQYYVEHYDEFESANNKALALKNYSGSSSWFYQGAPLGFVVDSDGNSHYFINVKGLPDDIKSSVKGGNANGKANMEYQDYASMVDVYGVTSDLRVYYCSNGKESLEGVDFAELDEADSTMEIFEAGSAMAKLITGSDEKNLTLEDLKGVKTLTITAESGITNFKDFYALVSLQELTLDGLTLNNLDGIENASQLYYIYFKSCVIDNYSSLGKLGNKLKYLYLYNIDDNELEKLCSKTIGIGNYDLPNLKYFAVTGTTDYIVSTSIYNTSYYSGTTEVVSTKTSQKTITSVECLNNLTENTKKAIQYISLQCNDILTLNGLESFSNLYLIRAEKNQISNIDSIKTLTSLKLLFLPYNNLTTLTQFSNGSTLNQLAVFGNSSLNTLAGIENCKQLKYIFAQKCSLGKELENSESFNTTDSLYALRDISSLEWIDLANNANVIWVKYLSKNTNVKYLRLTGCNNMNSNGIYEIKGIISSAGDHAYIPSNYSLALLDDSTTSLDLSDQTILKSEFEVLSRYISISKLSLKNIKIVDDLGNEIEDTSKVNEIFNNTLSPLTNMKFLNLLGCNYLSTLSFVENMNNLVELDIRSTAITDLSILERKRNDGTMFLGCLAVNTNINLGLIPKTIDGLYTYHQDYWNYVDNTRHGGLLCQSKEAWDSLNGSSITRLKLHSNSKGNVNLTSCTSLDKVVLEGNTILNLPTSITKVEGINYACPILNPGTNLEFFEVLGWPSYSSALNQLYKVNTIKEISFSYNNLNNLDMFSRLEGKNIEKMTIYFSDLVSIDASNFTIPSTVKTLSITTYNNNKAIINNMPSNILSNYGTSLTNLTIKGFTLEDVSFLSNLSLLKSLDISENKITVFPELSNLTQLTSINAQNNNISNVYSIRNLTGLESLNLQNNALYDTSTIINESGDKVTINNLETLANLNKTGALRNLYLAGNSGITNWTPVSSLNNWARKSGW